ncbi:Fe-S biogenesis protein NfuA [Arsenophonus symbiont of Ornithomya chloropus]|uniref:Fe-S biogenesis protein NfuA n=1 Tax=Arsenophonus symbiont of Ornithomya chloropus TaxID=634121 RepID=UPI0032B2E07E
MINITKAAQIHFRQLLEKKEPGTQIRIFVINPGTPTAECGVSYYPKNAIEKSDIEFKFDKFSAYVDKISLAFLKEAEIDLIKDQVGSQLTITAPHAKKNKIFDKSTPLTERIKYFIEFQINPQLAGHGGHVSLIKINNDGYAILQFGGGCNGCTMVTFTLKENIEKQLLNMFPNELKGVKDFTEHQHGNHSYY